MDKQALLSRVSAVVADIANAKAENSSKTAELARLAFQAFVADAHEDIVKSLKPTANWRKASGTWSGAISLARYLKAGNKLTVKSDKVPHYVIGGQNVDTLTGAHLEALGNPVDGDTGTISAFVKRMRDAKRVEAAFAQNNLAGEDNQIAAFLRSEAGTKYRDAGMDVSAVRAANIKGTITAREFFGMLEQGAEQLRVEDQAKAKAEREADATAQLAAVAGLIGRADGETLATLAGMIDARLAELAAGETMAELKAA